MNVKLFEQNILAVRLDPGEEIVASLLAIAEAHAIPSGIVYGIGAVSKASVGLLERKTKQFHVNELAEDLEITNLSGSLPRKDGKPYAHLHITLADASGHAFGGHLSSATIGVTAELFIRVLPEAIGRVFSPEIGVNLMQF